MSATTTVKPPSASGRKAKAPAADPSPSPSAPAWDAISDASAQSLPCACLLRHPLNRQPAEAAIAALAESLARVNQLEPILVRPMVDECIDGPVYQILSGETRWRAAIKLGWSTIAARVVALDDAQALLLVAEANEARKDLTTCEKARLIQRLCLPPAEGGSGLTREQAGRLFGLESGAAASNLVKLLDAPEAWQRRLDQPDEDCEGTPIRIHQGTVRAIAALTVTSGFVAEVLEAEYQQVLKDRYDGIGLSRDDQLCWVEQTVTFGVRVLFGTRYYGYQHGGDHKCYLDLRDKELRERLEIVSVPIGGKSGHDLVECATNVKLFDELQLAEIALRESAKARKGRGDKETGAAAADLSPKERAKSERAKRKEQDEQLEKWTRDWKHRLLRAALAEALDGDQAVWVLPWLMAAGSGSWRTPLQDLLSYAVETSRAPWAESLPDDQRKPGRIRQANDLCQLVELAEVLHDKYRSSERIVAVTTQQRLARLLLWPADSDTRDPKLIAEDLPEQLPYYEHQAIEQLARWAEVSLVEAWKQGATDGSIERRLIVQFLQRHTFDQLSDLSDELRGAPLGTVKKAAAVAELLASHRPGQPLPLPRILKDEAAKKGRKS